MLILTCETCVRAPSFTWGELAECASTGEDVKTVLSCCQSRNVCVNISVPVKLLAKSSASLWVLFSKPQTNGTRPPRAERALEGDLKASDAAWCGDSLLSWQQSCGPVRPEQRDNYRASVRLRNAACRRNTHRHNFHWIELTGLTWDGWTRRKAPIQNRHKVTEMKIFLYLYHNQACLKLQHVVFLPADTQQVFSCYLVSHFVFPSAYCWYFVWLSAYCSILFLKMLFGLNVLLDIEQFIPPAGLTEQ